MTDEELKITKSKLRLCQSKKFSEILSDFKKFEKTIGGTIGLVEGMRMLAYSYHFKLHVFDPSKVPIWKQRDIEDQINEEKNENPTIEE